MREIKFRAWDTDPEKEIDKKKKYMFYQKRGYGGGSWIADFYTDFNKYTGCALDSDYVFAHSKQFTGWDFVEKERKREQKGGEHINHDRFPDRFILMQYTGLKDKNGKEIFEGDIVRKNRKNGIIEWNNDIAGYVWRDSKVSVTALLKNTYKNCKVIGNIYENPELI